MGDDLAANFLKSSSTSHTSLGVRFQADSTHVDTLKLLNGTVLAADLCGLDEIGE